MSVPLQQRVRSLLQRARQLEEPERLVFLEEHCKGDAALAAELRLFFGPAIAGAPAHLETTLPRHPEEVASVEPHAARVAAATASAPPAESPLTPPGEHQDPPGELFGDYRLIREIGRGGMGVVYEAHQVSLDRRVALKVILDRRFDRASRGQNFLLEARMGARIRHPHSVGVYEFGEVHGQPYISMEYVDGENLATRLRSAPPTIEAAAFLVEKVARAVDVLHENGLIHRDLKPANILIDAQGSPKVTDFGVARSTASLVAEGSSSVAVGTPAYMAPEQAKGLLSAMGPWTDVFAIGAILYQLLCGRKPFDNDDRLALLLEVAEREPELPRNVRRSVPRALEAICLRCMEKDPSARYRRAAEVAEDLRRYLQRELVLARPLNWWQRVHRSARRRPVVASHLVALSIFFIMEQIWYARAAIDLRYHLTVCAIITAWTATCLVLEYGTRKAPSARWVALAWTALDVTFLTATLLNANGTGSALMALYYVLLALAGFWFRGSVVRVATGLVCLSYGVLMLDGAFRRPEFDQPYHADATYLVSFVVIGVIIGYQAERVRSLSRYMRGRT